MFITFEGIEGSGKSTQLKKCEEFLTKKGYPILVTKEPGGTDLGKTIRNWLLNPETTFHHRYSELLLFIADRCEHVESIIKPALSEKKIVLCDRFKDSTLAYQYAGRQGDKTLIYSLNNLVTIDPDITLLFDCRIETGLSRAKARAKLDRFEDENTAFHQRIQDMYHTLAKKHSDRFNIISTEDSIDNVFNKTISLLEEALHKKGYHES
ncbi:dTMP kinase [Candidatus Marinamargulisbacteria bacterium SCGC AG-343-D04]|nr:dTMP kinase [Candidatus Marinamargulisbacteria bacterium SCGC AG-343-D04]